MKDLQPEYRPDEKFISYGPKALSDVELLAIILRTGSNDCHSVELARTILTAGKENPDILSIFQYELQELQKIKGVGRVKALQVKAIAELSLRIAQSQARPQLAFDNPSSIADYYMEQLRHEKQEKVILLMLNSACDLIKEETISFGTVNASILSPREIFILSLKYEAVYIILLHNHPSGKAVPSQADLEFTNIIFQAGQIIGIKLLDHIIIGDHSYFSFKERHLIHE